MMGILRALIILLLIGIHTYGSDGWHFTSFWGGSHSLGTPIKFYRATDPDLQFTAEYHGRPFEDAWYYSLRIEDWHGNTARGWEWLHHKIYLANPQGDIDNFSISDGFNILYHNWATRHDNEWIHRWGLGLVFAHVDATFQGKDRFFMNGGIGGSYFSGISVQYSMEKWFWESAKHFGSIEGKLTVSYARTPISRDRVEFADVPNIAFHVLVGFGSKPPEKQQDISHYSHYIYPALMHLSIYPIEDIIGQ